MNVLHTGQDVVPRYRIQSLMLAILAAGLLFGWAAALVRRAHWAVTILSVAVFWVFVLLGYLMMMSLLALVLNAKLAQHRKRRDRDTRPS